MTRAQRISSAPNDNDYACEAERVATRLIWRAASADDPPLTRLFHDTALVLLARAAASREHFLATGKVYPPLALADAHLARLRCQSAAATARSPCR